MTFQGVSSIQATSESQNVMFTQTTDLPRLYISSLSRLIGNAWLNDELINSYASLMQKQSGNENVVVTDTFFADKFLTDKFNDSRNSLWKYVSFKVRSFL